MAIYSRMDNVYNAFVIAYVHRHINRHIEQRQIITSRQHHFADYRNRETKEWMIGDHEKKIRTDLRQRITSSFGTPQPSTPKRDIEIRRLSRFISACKTRQLSKAYHLSLFPFLSLSLSLSVLQAERRCYRDIRAAEGSLFISS